LLLAACGGGNDNSNENNDQNSPPTLTQINLTLSASEVPLGGEIEIKAQGLYSNQSSQNITKSVTWFSSDDQTIQINTSSDSSVYLHGLAKGSAKITASLDGVSHSLDINVGCAALKVIKFVPTIMDQSSDMDVALNAPFQMRAFGRYTDNTEKTLTNEVTWSSSDNNIVDVYNRGEKYGVIEGKTIGTASISANYMSIEASITVEVLPAQSISSATNPSMINPLIDDGGNRFIVSSNHNSEEFTDTALLNIYLSGSQTPITHTINTIKSSPYRSGPVIAKDDNDDLIIVFAEVDGLYTSKYSSITMQLSSPELLFTSSYPRRWGRQLLFDKNGNALMILRSTAYQTMYYMQYIKSENRWTNLKSFPFEYGSSKLTGVKLVMNTSGQAALVWKIYENTHKAYAAIFEPDEDGGTWQAPVNLANSSFFINPSIDINENGKVIVAWESRGMDIINDKKIIYSKVYDDHAGWLDTETISAEEEEQVEDPIIALNDKGDAAIAWNSYSGVKIRRYEAGNVWLPTEKLVSPYSFASLRFILLDVTDTGDVRIAWNISTGGHGGGKTVWSYEYSHENDWEENSHLFRSIGHKGRTHSSVRLTVNSNNEGVVTWTEDYDMLVDGIVRTFMDAYMLDFTFEDD
jgi:hypothetical protein